MEGLSSIISHLVNKLSTSRSKRPDFGPFHVQAAVSVEMDQKKLDITSGNGLRLLSLGKKLF